ncbi:ankyrin repeat domain-containing protein 26 isoform X2 [Anguilla rostrata]|uniref:ankyrin repeat domain-containing protein 26 isoform X2 n=1 Tax=Anguilla rostrata TaxID=7938 RepID=UPI0030CA5D4D
MKKIFSFAKKKKGFSPNSSDTGSVLSVGYEIKEKDLSKIHKAASSGDLSKLKQLAKKNDLSQLDKENRTPLHIACANGHVEIVQFLVESKAKLNLCDNQNRSPLMKAVQCQQERCVVTLLEHNADPNLVDINGNTALHLAALIPSISMAVQLLEHEANVNAQNKDGCTPLTLAVTENHVEMAEFLLKEGADMNAADQGERTSLMIAACNGQISMVRLLLRYNADVTIKDEKGWTSDDYAVMNGHHACSHLIIEHGTKGKTQPSPSHFASAGKKPAAVLGSPRHMAQAGPALGQPATDREELQLSGAAEAGKVDEDDSQAESISRASRRGAGDSWPSSDEDDLDFSPKKTQKPNLKKLMSASQKGRTDEGGLSDVAFTSKPRGNSQEEGESDSPEGQEEEESDEEDEDEEDEVDEEDEGDDDDEDDEEEDEDAEEESEEDEEVDEEQDEEEEEEDDMEKDDVAVAHIRNDGINDEELPRPVTAGADADIEEEADVEQPLVEGHDPHQSAAGTDQAAVTEDQEPMENVFRVKIRNDNGNDHEDEGLSKNIINEADNGTLGILDFGEDCVVSAIRVESGYSDEEEDHGNKENSDKDHVEARSPQEPKVLPQQNVGWNVQAEEPPFPDMSWGDDNNESDDLAHSPEEPKDPPLHTGLTLSGKSPEEPVSPDVSRRDEKDRVENSAKQKFIGSMSPVLAEPNLQKSSDKTLLGKEMDEPTSPVESWVEKKGVHVRASGHSHDISISGSHRKPMTLPQKNVGTNLLSKRRDQPSSPELSWGDEKDEDNEGPTYNDEALEMQPAAVIESKASDSWDSDEGNLKSEHLQPAGKVAEQQEYSAPVSLIVGHYEGPYEPKEDSGKIAAGSSKANEERVESPCMSAEKQSESDIDWGDEISNHEQLPQTAIDDVELDPPLGEDLEGLMVRATEDKRATNLKIYNAGASKDGISTEDDEEDEDEEDDDDEETKEDENEENKNIEVPDINTNAQDGQKSHGASVKQKSEPSKDVKRDFLSELGLEGGEEEEDSPWDSESGSDSPGKLQGVAHTPVKAHKVMASISEEKNEDPFYIPSFLRGSRHCRMANLEIPRRLVRTGDLSAPDLQDGGLEKKPVLKAQPAPVLPKPAEPKDDAVKNKDLMEELGLDDADDLEDASDWDTASTASRTIAGRKLASPSGEEPGERPPAAQSKAQGPPSPTARTPPLPSPRSSNPSTTLQPQPHPRARRLLPAKAESEEESDWDSESGTPASSPRKTGKLQPNLPEDKAISKPDILPHPRQLSPEDGGSRGSVESKEEPHKERHAVDTSGLDVSNPTHVTPGESHSRSTQEEEGTRTGDKASEPWEKRYEKIWVEIEKREVKSQFKSVAAELKEKFGETQKDAGGPTLDAGSGEDEDEHGEGDAPFRTAEEESSEEEEIIRPAARAKSLVLLPIPEQRESGLEDSATEPAESPQSERRARRKSGSPQDPCSAESSQRGEPDRITEKQENKQFPALRLPGSDLKDSDTDLDVDAGNCGKRKKELDSEESSIGEPKLKLHPSKESKLCASAQRTHNETEAEAEDSEPSPSPSLHTNPSASLRYSDEELEEDRHRFQREVGKLRVALLDLEKEKAQLRKEVGTEKKSIISEVQRPGGLWDGEGSSRQSVQESQVVKPPQTSRKQQLSEKGNGVTPKDKTREGLPQRDSPKSPKSGSTASKQEGDGVNTGERNAQRPPPRPRQAAHANGDPLSVFDDSTVSETSEDDGRSAAAGNRGNKEASEREMADDLDELTQSSDTPTEDEVSPTSGYRNASLLIQQLDSSSVDSVSMVKLQNMFHEYERTIQRERGRYSLLADKVSRLEKDRAELRRALEETREGRSVLERRQVELETDLNNLKFALKQEQEKHRNAAMLYDKSREQLRKKEEQQRAEAEERQRTELAMRNLELEMRALVNNMKQLEEDRNEAQRMLNQERSARALQEGVLSSHLRKQKEIEEENRRNFNKSSEAMSQLSEASDREKELMQQSRGLQEEVTSLQMELEHARSHSRQEEGRLSEESEALRERLEDVRRDLKLSEEALAQTVFQCNSQLSGLKAEASVAAAKLEHERQAREKLEAEAESARARLASALQEVERSQAGLAEAERALQRERDERQRAREKLDAEAAAQRDAIHGLSQRLGKAEAKANGLENECHRSALALTEKTLLLETAEREREQALARLAERDAALLAEREQRSKAAARQEALQERLGQAQSENMLLRQQLEEAHSRGAVKERAVSDAQERFGDMLAKLRSDSEERVHMVEERSRELAEKNTELREQVRKQEQENAEREAKLRQLQQELADSLKKLSMSEASLEVNTRYRSDLEDEKLRLQKEMDRLKGKLQESEEQFVQSERRLHSLKSTLDDKEREIIASSQKLQEVLSASTAAEKTIKQLEEAVQRLEIENARLEAAAKQQTNRIEVLQKGVQEAALPSDSSPGGMVRNRLEGLVTDLQGAKINLEDQLSREVQKQSVLSHNAQGSHQLWEEELKSRSRLGLRLAELEKEKEDLSTQMDIERKKVKKIAEQKKSVDVRLEQEMKRNTDLQKEMLRTLVKTAKKKLREQDSGDVASPLSSLRGEMGHRQMDADAAVGRMKVDELSLQLEKEALKCSRLEAVNGELKEQLSSLRSLSKSHERLERSKRQLEEEVSGLRRQMETSMMDQSQAEQYRRETEERARQEIRHKLEEVNLFLQTQAASQEALEQIKAANEASLRSQLEQRVRDLDSELSRLRTSQQDSLSQRDSTKTELERYRELYAEELRLRKSLGAKLERSNERLAEANGRLLSERQRSKSLITSGIVNGGLAGPSLDMGPLGSVGAYGATLGPLNRSLSLGGSFLSPVGEGHNSRVEAYLAKMQSELEKNISKELDHAAAELEGGSARLSPVGSAAGSQKTLNVDQDPVTRATQQYLEVLKKNYMI